MGRAAATSKPAPRGRRVQPGAPPGAALVTGACGEVGPTVVSALAKRGYRVTTTDVREPTQLQPPEVAEHVLLDLSDEQQLTALASRNWQVVVHLATGQSGGWPQLMTVEVQATRLLLEALSHAKHDLRRVLLASSNHVVGGHEAAWLADGMPLPPPVYPVDAPARPDGDYAAAKCLVEGLGRFYAEFHGVPVSALRIGTFRCVDDIEAYADAPEFLYIGDARARRRRLSATWLRHDDLVRILDEELEARQLFRLRFAHSAAPGHELWDASVLTWDQT